MLQIAEDAAESGTLLNLYSVSVKTDYKLCLLPNLVFRFQPIKFNIANCQSFISLASTVVKNC